MGQLYRIYKEKPAVCEVFGYYGTGDYWVIDIAVNIISNKRNHGCVEQERHDSVHVGYIPVLRGANDNKIGKDPPELHSKRVGDLWVLRTPIHSCEVNRGTCASS